jgi:putative NIF3 family GTP cyclohydrolase 1 type 2
MKLIDLFSLAIEFGGQNDPRGKGRFEYADSRILYGRKDAEIKKVMVGIDIEAPEILLAERIRQREGLDLVIAHHPEGSAWASFYEVMDLQIDMLQKTGIRRPVAEAMVEERKREVARKVLSANHMRTVDAARLLDIPLVCLHTVADNFASTYIHRLLHQNKPRRLQDVIDILEKVPEYKLAMKAECGPRIILGSPGRQAGKIFVEMTGGTEGSRKVFDKLYKTGIRTLVSMHLSEEHFRKAGDANLNVVIAGHISSDTLGLNLLLDKIERHGKLEVIESSGFRRIRR